MTESTVKDSSRDFAPSWLRSTNHSPTPPFRPNILKDRASDDWPDRKSYSGFPRWGSSDQQSDSFFLQNQERQSDFENDHSVRRSNSINSERIRGTSLSSPRSSNGSQISWNSRSKFDSPFRGHHTNGFRDSHKDCNGISYSFVTSKSLKPEKGKTSPVLQQSDFPSLGPTKETPAKPAQVSVWGNPPHLSKTGKRSSSTHGLLENGTTVLGPHYGKGFFSSSFGRDFKDDLNDVLSTIPNDHDSKGYEKTHSDDALHLGDDSDHHGLSSHESSSGDARLMNGGGCWALEDMSHKTAEHGGSLLSSSGSTGSVESIDSHQSHMSGGAAMMVEDLLDETISEDEKMRIFRALEKIKERTGHESYYERVALLEAAHRTRAGHFAFADGKSEEDDEDPDDRFLK